MKPVIHPVSSLAPEISKHVFTAGVVAGACLESLRSAFGLQLAIHVAPAVPEPFDRRGKPSAMWQQPSAVTQESGVGVATFFGKLKTGRLKPEVEAVASVRC